MSRAAFTVDVSISRAVSRSNLRKYDKFFLLRYWIFFSTNPFQASRHSVEWQLSGHCRYIYLDLHSGRSLQAEETPRRVRPAIPGQFKPLLA